MSPVVVADNDACLAFRSAQLGQMVEEKRPGGSPAPSLWPETTAPNGADSAGLGSPFDMLAFRGYSARIPRVEPAAGGWAANIGGGSIHWIDVDMFASERSIHGAHDGSPRSWAMSPDRSRAATGTSDGWVKV